MSTRRRLGSEDGTGSVEMVLILPFYLLLLLLIIHGSRLMLLNEVGSVATRNAAWRASVHRDFGRNTLSAIGVSLPGATDLGQNFCSNTEVVRRFGGEFGIVSDGFLGSIGPGQAYRGCAPGDESFGEEYVDAMVEAGRAKKSDIGEVVTDTLNADVPPYITRVTGKSKYEAVEKWQAFSVTDPFEWETKHSISANRSWEHVHLDSGFDEKLKENLGFADFLFSDVFPGAD